MPRAAEGSVFFQIGRGFASSAALAACATTPRPRVEKSLLLFRHGKTPIPASTILISKRHLRWLKAVPHMSPIFCFSMKSPKKSAFRNAFLFIITVCCVASVALVFHSHRPGKNQSGKNDPRSDVSQPSVATPQSAAYPRAATIPAVAESAS
ncbi:MAG: hypothetical protein LBM04_04180, partial [Opitutaceae bacterium]|nr:hypothetical protein [Opitutaceae bacterium]